MERRYLDFLYRLGVFNIKLGLQTMQSALEQLGNPHRHPKIIHLAGTNGKGSTLCTLEHLLLKSGYSTGATISPHLISYNERIRINGQAVSDTDLDIAFEEVATACGIDVRNLAEYNGDAALNPTFFEFTLLMAFVLFQKFNVDFVLLETGLGGRLDASNVVENPIACVFTRIDYDHQEYLGDTIELIAGEKLAIIKKGAKLFAAAQIPEVLQQIIETAHICGNDLSYFGRDFGFQNDSDGLVRFFSNNRLDQTNELELPLNTIGLKGDHQLENISTALAIYHQMIDGNRQLPHAKIIECINNLEWPGRLQYIEHHPRLLLDGAHNDSGMESLTRYVNEHHRDDRILFVVSWMEGKQIEQALGQLSIHSLTFQPIKIRLSADVQTEQIVDCLQRTSYPVLPVKSVENLVNDLEMNRYDDYSLILMGGSLYLLGEFLEAFKI